MDLSGPGQHPVHVEQADAYVVWEAEHSTTNVRLSTLLSSGAENRVIATGATLYLRLQLCVESGHE
jgi:hypothetical protein